jgi:hypothetical protein
MLLLLLHLEHFKLAVAGLMYALVLSGIKTQI